jgi:Prokaryotic E2 family E
MSIERISEELALLRNAYPDLEYRPAGHWIRIPGYPVPKDVWNQSEVEVCFQIPEQIPGQQPYGFYVRPGLTLRSSSPIDNYTFPAPTGFGDDWGKFSWQLLVWAPKDDIVAGTNMLNFARSIADRLREGK